MRTRTLQERRLPGKVVSLQDDPEKTDGYVLRIVCEERYNEFYEAMDGFRAAVAKMVNDDVSRTNP